MNGNTRIPAGTKVSSRRGVPPPQQSGRTAPASGRAAASSSTRSFAARVPSHSGRNQRVSDEPEYPDSRRSGRSSARGGKPDNKNLIIGISVGAAVLLLMGIVAFKGSGKKPDTKSAAQVDFTDKTSSSTWAQRAASKEARGDRLGAASDYNSAAEASEREGNSQQAQNYSMKAYQIRKTTTLNVSGQK